MLSNMNKKPKTTTIEGTNYIRKDIVFKGALIIAAFVSPIVGYVLSDVVHVAVHSLY